MSQERQPVDVNELLMIMADQIASVAWSKLGLQPDPITGEITKDLAQANLAIDVLAFLANKLEPNLDDADKREILNLVSNLKINYVEKLKEN